MPRTATNFGGFSGFSPDVPNPFIRMPDGRRMLISDISDAAAAMDLGGSSSGGTRGGPSIQSIPQRPAQPARGLTPDNSNAGLVNRNLFRQDNQANTEWWTGGGQNPNRPHSAMDFETNPNVSAEAGRALDTGASGGLNGVPLYSPTPSESFDTGGLHNYGEPSVQVPTSDARYPSNLENAPSLFPDQNEWWRNGAMAQGAATGNNGGAIWSDNIASDPSGAGIVSSRLFQDDGLRYTPAPNVDPLDGLHTYDETAYQPTVDPSDPFTLNVYDETRYTNAPADDDNDLSGLHSYGYPGSGNLANFGGGMSLGNYLNTPLSDMRYGEGYPVQGGFVDTSSGNAPTGDVQIDPLTGRPFDLDAIPTATGGTTYTSGDWRENAASAPMESPNWFDPNFVLPPNIQAAIDRGDYPSAYGQGQNRPREAGYSGSGQSFSTMMAPHWFGGIQGSPLRWGASEAGRTIFGNPARGAGYFDVETQSVRRKPRGTTASGVRGIPDRGG